MSPKILAYWPLGFAGMHFAMFRTCEWAFAQPGVEMAFCMLVPAQLFVASKCMPLLARIPSILLPTFQLSRSQKGWTFFFDPSETSHQHRVIAGLTTLVALLLLGFDYTQQVDAWWQWYSAIDEKGLPIVLLCTWVHYLAVSTYLAVATAGVAFCGVVFGSSEHQRNWGVLLFRMAVAVVVGYAAVPFLLPEPSLWLKCIYGVTLGTAALGAIFVVFVASLLQRDEADERRARQREADALRAEEAARKRQQVDAIAQPFEDECKLLWQKMLEDINGRCDRLRHDSSLALDKRSLRAAMRQEIRSVATKCIEEHVAVMRRHMKNLEHDYPGQSITDAELKLRQAFDLEQIVNDMTEEQLQLGTKTRRELDAELARKLREIDSNSLFNEDAKERAKEKVQKAYARAVTEIMAEEFET